MSTRRQAIPLLAAAAIGLQEIVTHAKPACRPNGHPSEGKGNVCCSGVDDGHLCIPDPNGGDGAPPTIITIGIGGGENARARCRTGETALACCRRAVKKATKGKQIDRLTRKRRRRRGFKVCAASFGG